MGKGKLAKFADMASYENVFQYPYSVVEHVPFEMKGHWHEQYFHNQNPIVLELGCGRQTEEHVDDGYDAGNQQVGYEHANDVPNNKDDQYPPPEL